MANLEEIQNMATEQALREQNQQLRKQLEDMNAQIQALMAQQQGNTTAQSSQTSQEAPPQNVEQMACPPAQATVQNNLPQQESTYPAFISTPQVATAGQAPSGNKQTEQLEYILNKLNMLEGNQGAIDPAEYCIVTDFEIPRDFKVPDFSK
jgi:TolA-binding protein